MTAHIPGMDARLQPSVYVDMHPGCTPMLNPNTQRFCRCARTNVEGVQFTP